MTLDEQRAEILRLLLALPPKRQIYAIDKLRKWQRGATPMRNPRAKKAAKTKAKSQPAKIDPATEKRVQAYRDMESHLCDVVKMGTIAFQLFDDPDRELYDFAVCRLSELLDEPKVRYYAQDFPI
jgi:hypothetical protein